MSFILITLNYIKPWILPFKVFFILAFCGTRSIGAQNSFERRIEASDIERIVVNGNQIFNISVSTHKSKNITMRSTIDGEYQEQFQITNTKHNQTLYLKLEQNPLMTIPDDKRNAHKVVAASLNLVIPVNLDIDIKSDIGSVDLTGYFKDVTVQLFTGFCKVQGQAKAALVNTVDGDIDIKTSNAEVIANSTYGSVETEIIPLKQAVWRLKSIYGNISVKKQE
ncbi:DUF4097 family beta strand repeat-containing protein [Winogradskyella aurantia]|uniref:Adhesin domain-containing protein n=1 Tax=Winogradskyella aurantia TaxID=1915063 RepID=A0A265UZC8_9FLAO|nr:hypothetical protein [Winogradskyella aurantia]OZV70663.1 hypothetical protein CA834_00685 [Winogradskyella aurantia]